MSNLFLWVAQCPEGQEHDAAYALLAEAVRETWGLSPLPKICREPEGKPYFPAYPQLHFNLSHSHGGVVCGLHHMPLGVDIEKLREPPKRLGSGMSAEDFFHLWTGREATVKQEGKGIPALMHPFAPSSLCQWFPHLIPGFEICVCPGESTEITVKVLQYTL